VTPAVRTAGRIRLLARSGTPVLKGEVGAGVPLRWGVVNELGDQLTQAACDA